MATLSASPAVSLREKSSQIVAQSTRLVSVDVLRGLVMVIMALDHVRDFMTNIPFVPEDLTNTYSSLFFTRFVTHFCAPVFSFLAAQAHFWRLRAGNPSSRFRGSSSRAVYGSSFWRSRLWISAG